MKRLLCLLGLAAVICLTGSVTRAERKPPAADIPAGFDRPLVIDRYLERKVAGLEEKVATLEAAVEQLREQVRHLQPEETRKR